MIKNIFAFLSAGIWISASEFIRNELLFKSLWLEKYKSLGVEFPSAPMNNALWGVWSFIFAGIALYLSKKMGLLEMTVFLWVSGFLMMCNWESERTPNAYSLVCGPFKPCRSRGCRVYLQEDRKTMIFN